LGVGTLHERTECFGAFSFVRVDPRRVEDDEGVVREERPFLRVHRNERDPGWARLLTGVEHTVGVALVVVDDRLLLDGDRRHVRQRRAPHVVAEPVVEERHRDVAVVHDRRLDPARELLHRRAFQVFEAEVFGLAGRGVVLRDGGVQRAGREVGVRLAEPERSPLGMVVRAPTFRVAREGEDVGVADGALRVPERLGHRLRHRDDERRHHDRLARARHLGFATPIEPLVEDGAPGARGRRPHDRLRAVRRRVRPALRQQLHPGPRRLGLYAHEGAGLVAERSVVGLVEVSCQRGEQRDFLRRHRHVDGDAVARIGEVGLAVAVLAFAAAATGARRQRDQDASEHRHEDAPGHRTASCQ
jgi:hypothetical protein